MWALLLLVAVITCVHWWEWSRVTQEYTFAKATVGQEGLRDMMAEKIPVAMEIGELPWRPDVAAVSPWLAATMGAGDDGGIVEMPITEWIKERPALENQSDLATQMELPAGLAELDAGRGWWWLPGIRSCSVDLLRPGEIVGFDWTSAERSWIGCSHGGPLTLWLVHSKYRRYIPDPTKAADPIDPWSLTVADAPWIGKVQFIEVVVKPGWCMGLPAHWGYALRCGSESEAWWWKGAQHSVLSYIVNN
jgi:hypothetical protein